MADTLIIYLAIGILLIFGILLVLFLVCSNAYLDEMRIDWEGQREQQHDKREQKHNRRKQKHNRRRKRMNHQAARQRGKKPHRFPAE